MPTFTIGETKIRPGEYHRHENAGSVEIAGATNGIVAGVLRSNWGPLNKVVEIDAGSNIKELFGTGNTGIITEAFKADVTRGYFVRVGTGGTAATVTLKDTAAEAANVVTITAKYPGTREFTVSIRDSLVNTDNRECVIYDGTAEFEKVTFAKGTEDGEAAALVAAFAKSTKFTATKVADGNKTLATVTQAAFTPGTDATVNTEAYSAALSALEAYRFNALCVDSTDTAVHALVDAFVDRTFQAGAYPMAVLADAAEVEFDTKLAHAKAFNDFKVIYVATGGIDAEGNNTEGYLAAARVAGLIAATPANQSITHTIVEGYTAPSQALTNTEVEKALLAGCVVFTTSSDGSVWVEQGINTLVNPGDDEDAGWSKIRRVKTRFELMQRIGDTVETLIGKVDNTSDGRATIIAAAQKVINTMIGERKLSSGLIVEDTANPARGDSAWFVVSADDVDSIEKFYLTYRFRFAADD
ncbi:MAG: phage tail sheath subtilisin-like domain-containing protein [Ruminococcus sp.]